MMMMDTFPLIKDIERLHKVMLDTLKHSYFSFLLILKCPG
jgi:hypothetical protein